MQETPTSLILTIRHRGKAIPYPGVERVGVPSNYGFKPLKGIPDAGRYIPEATDDPALSNAISSINAKGTAFFTIGCEKAFNRDESGGHWAKGYLEFAHNYPELVADARYAFAVFFNFSHELVRSRLERPVLFHWELEGARFLDATCDGFSITVWIETGTLPSRDEAVDCWEAALERLTMFLVDIPQPPGRVIYS